jgi:hypothetical protein
VHTKVGNVQKNSSPTTNVTLPIGNFHDFKGQGFKTKKALCKQISFCEGSPKSGEGRKEVPKFFEEIR